MQVGNVAFSLSPEAQRAAAQKLSTQAIDSFRQQAQASAQAFGYSSYTIREVSVNHDGGSQPRPVMMMQARGMSADAKMAAPDGVGSGNVDGDGQRVGIGADGALNRTPRSCKNASLLSRGVFHDIIRPRSQAAEGSAPVAPVSPDHQADSARRSSAAKAIGPSKGRTSASRDNHPVHARIPR